MSALPKSSDEEMTVAKFYDWAATTPGRSELVDGQPVGVAVKRDVALAGERSDEREGLLDQVRERDRLWGDRHLPRLDPSEVEHLVDER